MGLATDKQGLPSTMVSTEAIRLRGLLWCPFVSELKKKFNVKSFTVVADRGLNSQANIDALIKLGDNYVLASKIRGASSDIQREVLSEEGRVPIQKVSEDGEILDFGWYKEIQLNGPISYESPEYVFEDGDKEKEKQLEKNLNHTKTKSPGNT